MTLNRDHLTTSVIITKHICFTNITIIMGLLCCKAHQELKKAGELSHEGLKNRVFHKNTPNNNFYPSRCSM